MTMTEHHDDDDDDGAPRRRRRVAATTMSSLFTLTATLHFQRKAIITGELEPSADEADYPLYHHVDGFYISVRLVFLLYTSCMFSTQTVHFEGERAPNWTLTKHSYQEDTWRNLSESSETAGNTSASSTNRGIPDFWLDVMKSSKLVAPLIKVSRHSSSPSPCI